MKSFLPKNLFDLSFDKFLVTTMVRVIFVIGCVAALVGILFFAYVNSHDEGMWIVFPILPVLFLVVVAVLRFILEMHVALVRIAENTTKLVEMKESKEALPVMRDDQTE